MERHPTAKAIADELNGIVEPRWADFYAVALKHLGPGAGQVEDHFGIYRVDIEHRATGRRMPTGAAVFANSDIEAADALEASFPSKQFRWFERSDGHEIKLGPNS